MDPAKRILQISSVLFSLTLVSRVLGLVRDILIAWILGSGAVADIVACALRIPHVLRRALNEGALSLTLTRFFSVCSCEKEPSDMYGLHARTLYSQISWRIFLILLLAAGLFLLFSRPVAGLLAPSLSEAQRTELGDLLHLVAPYIVCAGMSATAMAYLHARGVFWVSAIGPVLLNICMICCLVIGFFCREEAGFLLLTGFCLGGVLQWGIQWICLRRMKEDHTDPPDPVMSQVQGKILDTDRALRKTATRQISVCLREIPGGILAASAQQLAFLVGMIFLSGWGEGQVAGQFYAERILELPISLISVCLGMASLPTLSQLADRQKYVRFARQLSVALYWALFLLVPALLGILAVGQEFIAVTFGHGRFTSDGVILTWEILCAYLTGLPACVVSRILLSGCVALRGTDLCCVVTVCTLLCTVLFCAAGLFPPVGVSLAMWIQVFLLGGWISGRLRPYTRRFFFWVRRLLRGAGIASVACLLAHVFLSGAGPLFQNRFLPLLFSVLLAIGVWIILLRSLAYREYRHLVHLYRKRMRRA